MNRFSKPLALLLTLAICMSLVPMTALAEGNQSDLSYQVIVTPQYEDAKYFSEGMAPVQKGGKWGFVDTAGKLVIAPAYEYASIFSEGKAIVGKKTVDAYGQAGYLMGFVDAAGTFTPMTTAEQQQYFIADYAMIAVNEAGEETGRTVNYVFHNGYAMLPVAEYYGYIAFDAQGKEKPTGVTYGFYDSLFNEGMAQVLLDAVANDYVTYVDASGKTMLQLPQLYADVPVGSTVFSNAYGFYGGTAGAWVATKPDMDTWEGEELEYHFALINRQGTLLFTGNYDRVAFSNADTGQKVLNDGLVSLRKADTQKWGAVNASGQVIVPFEYDSISTFTEGAAAVSQNGKWGLVDTAGKVLVQPKYARCSALGNGIAVVVDGTKAYCIDRYGNQVKGSDGVNQATYFPEGLDSARTLNPSEYIVLNENGKYGFAKLTVTLALPQKAEMSEWAYEEVIRAIGYELIPDYLQNQYRTDINRADFCQLIVQAVEQSTGKDIATLLQEKTGKTMAQAVAAYPFQDTANQNIIAAHYLGIIDGTGDKRFTPYGYISRQDAAALLMRAAKLVGGDVKVEAMTFADGSQIAGYAKDAVQYVASLKIMNGTGNDNFSPSGSYTREQAYVTICRLFEAVKAK